MDLTRGQNPWGGKQGRVADGGHEKKKKKRVLQRVGKRKRGTGRRNRGIAQRRDTKNGG